MKDNKSPQKNRTKCFSQEPTRCPSHIKESSILIKQTETSTQLKTEYSAEICFDQPLDSRNYPKSVIQTLKQKFRKLVKCNSLARESKYTKSANRSPLKKLSQNNKNNDSSSQNKSIICTSFSNYGKLKRNSIIKKEKKNFLTTFDSTNNLYSKVLNKKDICLSFSLSQIDGKQPSHALAVMPATINELIKEKLNPIRRYQQSKLFRKDILPLKCNNFILRKKVEQKLSNSLKYNLFSTYPTSHSSQHIHN